MAVLTISLKTLLRLTSGLASGLVLLVYTAPAAADTAEARCDIYLPGDDHATETFPCRFSQRQGYITIYRDDGITHDLRPMADTVGTYQDQEGRMVYREGGLDDQGLIFRFPFERVFVYWDTSALQSAATATPTAPYSTTDYDATTLLKCGPLGQPSGSCPAGILRMENKQASIVVTGPTGDEFTFNFMRDYVNATNRDVEARLQDDTWIVNVDGKETYEVPLAAIEGG